MKYLFNYVLLNLFLILFVFINLTILSCSKSYATRTIPNTTASLARQSNDIVVARCLFSETKKDEVSGFVFTYIYFDVKESLKGYNYQDDLVLRIIGGQMDGTTLNTPGKPRFYVDEEVIMFLSPKNKDGYYTLSSFERGLYRIGKDQKTNEKIITTPVVELGVYRENSREFVPYGENIRYEDFIYTLRQLSE